MLGPVGALTQVVRGSMIESLNSGFVLNARSRGYSPNRIAYRHGLRNAMLPVIAVAGDKAAGMVNGSIIVGTIFAWPGIGTVMVQAVVNRDFALIQAGVLVIGVTIIILNIGLDLIYSAVDPRIRLK
jgi:peptide/nickel transport system permease protein